MPHIEVPLVFRDPTPDESNEAFCQAWRAGCTEKEALAISKEPLGEATIPPLGPGQYWNPSKSYIRMVREVVPAAPPEGNARTRHRAKQRAAAV